MRSRLIAALAGIAVWAAPAPALADGVDNFDDTAAQPFMGIWQTAQRADIAALSSQTNEFLSLLGPGYCKPETTTDPDAYVDNTAWWKVQGNGRTLFAYASPSGRGTMVAVYDSREAVFPAGVPATPTYLDCGFDPSFGHGIAVARWNSVAGKAYWIQAGACMRAVVDADDVPCHVAGPDTSFDVWVSSAPPANDEAGAAAALGARAAADNNGATLAGGERSNCSGATYDKTVWFRHTASEHGLLQVSIAGLSGVVTLLRAYDGAVVGCGPTAATARVVRGGEYLVQVGGVGFGTGASESAFTIEAAVIDPDHDFDGSLASVDCDDNNTRRKARADGGKEKRGNAVDEDCDGVAQPYRSIRTKAKLSFEGGRPMLKLIRLPARAKLKIRCSRCSKSSLGRSFRLPRKRLVLTTALGSWFRGARVKVDVTARRRVGRRWTWRMLQVPKFAGECRLVPGVKPRC